MREHQNVLYRMIAILVVAVMGATTAGAAAYAVPKGDVVLEEASSTPTVPATQPDEVTFREYRALFNALEESDVARTEDVVDGVRLVTFVIDGSALTLADLDEREYSTQISVGLDGRGPWVQFNPTDQRAIISGGTTAIVLGICALTAGTACAVASALVAAAAVYLSEYGTCSNNRHFRVYIASGRFPIHGCVTV